MEVLRAALQAPGVCAHGNKPGAIAVQIPRVAPDIELAPEVQARLAAIDWPPPPTPLRGSADMREGILAGVGCALGGFAFVALTLGVWVAGVIWLVNQFT